MGIKRDEARKAIKKHSVTTALSALSKTLIEQHERKPIAAADVSVWIRASLTSVRAKEQFHLIPEVPVTAVSEYVLSRANGIKTKIFDLVLVFDGARNPLKANENSKQNSVDLNKLKDMLCHAYKKILPQRNINLLMLSGMNWCIQEMIFMVKY